VTLWVAVWDRLIPCRTLAEALALRDCAERLALGF